MVVSPTISVAGAMLQPSIIFFVTQGWGSKPSSAIIGPMPESGIQTDNFREWQCVATHGLVFFTLVAPLLAIFNDFGGHTGTWPLVWPILWYSAHQPSRSHNCCSLIEHACHIQSWQMVHYAKYTSFIYKRCSFLADHLFFAGGWCSTVCVVLILGSSVRKLGCDLVEPHDGLQWHRIGRIGVRTTVTSCFHVTLGTLVSLRPISFQGGQLTPRNVHKCH